MKRVLFFLSAQNVDKKYSKPALELVRKVIQSGYAFVYGGSQRGLMKEAAEDVKKLNGHIIAVSSVEFANVVNKQAHKIVVTKNIPERIQILLEESDAVIALPGGSGTLDEITAVIEQKKLGHHIKPIILFNTEGFWEGLVSQYQHMFTEGFLPKNPKDLFFLSDNSDKIIEYLKKIIS